MSLPHHPVVLRTCDGCGNSYSSSYLRTHQRKHCSVLKKTSTEAPTSFPSEEDNLSFAGTSDKPILDDFGDFSPIAGPSQPSGSWPSPHSGMDKPKSLGSGMDISGGPTVQNMPKAFACQCEEPLRLSFHRILGGLRHIQMWLSWYSHQSSFGIWRWFMKCFFPALPESADALFLPKGEMVKLNREMEEMRTRLAVSEEEVMQ